MAPEEKCRINGEDIFESEANVIKWIRDDYFDYLDDVRNGIIVNTQNLSQKDLDEWYWYSRKEFKFYLYSENGHIIELAFDLFPVKLPDNISDLKYLKNLSLIECRIQKYPPSFSKLDSLTHLNLSFNEMKVLPKEILNLKNIERIYIGHNEFSDLNPIINNFDHLIQLSASNNLIKTIPQSISRLKKLMALDLNHNSISSIPEELFKLQELEFLHLSNNRLEEISESLGNLRKLEILSLDNNEIRYLPDSIGNLQNLVALGITHNKLKKIPDSIGSLELLNRIFLSHNNISEIPESIGDLHNLTALHLNNNKLEKIPDSIGNLQNLKRLEIARNQLKELPYSISKILDLEFIIFKNNNFIQPPKFTNLSVIPSLSVAYDDLDGLRTALESSKELGIVDLLKNLRGNPKKLEEFYSYHFRFLDYEEKQKLPKKVIHFVDNEDFKGLIGHFQPDLTKTDKPNLSKKITKFSNKTKRKKIISSKKITKFETKPQAIVKEKLQIIAQMENQMKKLRIEIPKLPPDDPKKLEKEKMLESLRTQLNQMKKKFKF